MKPSWSIFQPAEAEGKIPYWLFKPNLEEPSRRTVAMLNIYLHNYNQSANCENKLLPVDLPGNNGISCTGI
jgi:hypothetical protein